MPVESSPGRSEGWLRAYVPAVVMVFLFVSLYTVSLGPALRQQAVLVQRVKAEGEVVRSLQERSRYLNAQHRGLETDPPTQERAYRRLYPGAAEPGEIRLPMLKPGAPELPAVK
ncbi:MAG: hypothetical protein AB1486_34950 [Planctomycetota bacterium]